MAGGGVTCYGSGRPGCYERSKPAEFGLPDGPDDALVEEYESEPEEPEYMVDLVGVDRDKPGHS